MKQVMKNIDFLLETHLDFDTDNAPDEEIIAQNRLLLESSYYSINCMGEDVSPEAKVKWEAEDKLRRADGESLVTFYTGRWSEWPPKHNCRGCCTDRSDAVNKASKLYKCIICRRLAVPSLNKWLSLWPVVAFFCVALCLHGLFARAYSLTSFGRENDESSGSSEGARLGADAARNEKKLFKRQKFFREKKSREFLNTAGLKELFFQFLHDGDPP